MAGMLLAALDQTIVTTSIRTIVDDLNGLSLQARVSTAYLITSTLSTPLYGKLPDLYGRKLLMPEVPLRTQSGLQARLTDAVPPPAVPGAVADVLAAAVPSHRACER